MEIRKFGNKETGNLKRTDSRGRTNCDTRNNRFQLRRLLKSKRSQGHVEMIVSFVIFVGFVIAMFYFLEPFKNRQINYTILDITEDKLLEQWESEYKTVSVTFDSGVSGCFSVVNSLGLNGNLVVEDELGKLHDGSLSGGIQISSGPGTRRYFKLYASPDFEYNDVSCLAEVDPLENPYTFGALNTQEKVFYNKIGQMVEKYNSDYNGLKQELGLQNDFMFFVKDQTTGETLTSAEIFVPRVVEVRARDIPVVALDENAEQLNLIINIRAW